jgi:hypothetical protein
MEICAFLVEEADFLAKIAAKYGWSDESASAQAERGSASAAAESARCEPVLCLALAKDYRFARIYTLKGLLIADEGLSTGICNVGEGQGRAQFWCVYP